MLSHGRNCFPGYSSHAPFLLFTLQRVLSAVYRCADSGWTGATISLTVTISLGGTLGKVVRCLGYSSDTHGPSAMLVQRTQGVLDTDCNCRETFCSTGPPGLSSDLALRTISHSWIWCHWCDASKTSPRILLQFSGSRGTQFSFPSILVCNGEKSTSAAQNMLISTAEFA